MNARTYLRNGAAAAPTWRWSMVARRLDALARRTPQPAIGAEFPVAGDGEAPLQAGVKLDHARRGCVQDTLFRGPL